ncbi:hypothetical protein BDR06DRAFT_1062633 [Suillus hirtellus]|nr:hypothetical protein BDR06DRAFT_1062633 [Suillus hirtellus]
MVPPLPPLHEDLMLDVFTHCALTGGVLNDHTPHGNSDRPAQLRKSVLNTIMTYILFVERPMLSGEELQRTQKFLTGLLFGTLWHFAKVQTVGVMLEPQQAELLSLNWNSSLSLSLLIHISARSAATCLKGVFVFQVEKGTLEVEANEDGSGSKSDGDSESNSLLSKALDILATYLTSSPVAPLNKEYIETELPLCLYIDTHMKMSLSKHWIISKRSYPDTVVADFEELRKYLMDPTGVRMSVMGNALDIPKPRSVWSKHFGDLLPHWWHHFMIMQESKLAPLKLTSHMLSELGYHSQLANNQKLIRQLHYESNRKLPLDREAGLLTFSLYQSSNSLEMFKQAKEVISGLVDGTVALEETALDAAKSSIIYGITKNVTAAGQAVYVFIQAIQILKYRHYMLLGSQNELATKQNASTTPNGGLYQPQVLIPMALNIVPAQTHVFILVFYLSGHHNFSNGPDKRVALSNHFGEAQQLLLKSPYFQIGLCLIALIFLH